MTADQRTRRQQLIDYAPTADWWDPEDGTFDNEVQVPKRAFAELIRLALAEVTPSGA